MKKILFGVTFLAMSSVCAFAADLPARAYTKAMPPAPVGYDWTGVYVGGHVGGGWGETDVVDNNFVSLLFGLPNTQRVNTSGFQGGVQAGFNYQIGKAIIGTEYNFSWSDIKGTATNAIGIPGFTVSRNDRLQDYGTAVTRLGFTPWDRFMVYSTAGAAWAHFNTNDTVASAGGFVPYAASCSESRIGWTVGTGAEWAFMNNWSAKLQYDYMDFGRRTTTLAPFGTFPIALDTDRRVSTVSVGLNYKFAAGAAFGGY